MNLKLLTTITTILLSIDFIWLTLIAKNFYAEQFSNNLKTPVNLYAALGVYALLILGIFIFVFHNNYAINEKNVILLGALFGFITYGVYDLTNLATLQHWSITLTIVDMAWGTFLISATSILSYLIQKNFF